MRWTTTLILILLVVAGYFVMRHLQENEPEPPPLRTRLIDDEILRDFETAELTLFSKEIVKIVRHKGGRFSMEFGRTLAGEPWIYEDEIDLDLALQFLQTVDATRRDEDLGEADEDTLLRFNLKPPKYRIELTGGGRSQEIHFGADDRSTKGSILALDVEENRVFRVGRAVVNMLDLNMLDWRDKRTFTFDPQVVDFVQIVHARDMEGPRIDPPELLTAERQERDRWTVSDGAETYKADDNKVRGLIQRLTTLRVLAFKAEDFDNPDLLKLTDLPDNPVALLSLGSGTANEVLMVGLQVAPDQTSAIMPTRDDQATFAVEQREMEKILAVRVDDLRYRRLAPAFETSLVALESRRPDGERLYRVERAARIPRGNWAILDEDGERGPGVYEGSGEYSWPQLIVDLDRLEVEEFLPAADDFEPQVVLRIEWMNHPVVRDLEFELMRRGEQVLARASDRPEELLVVPELLWDAAHLELDRYRERGLFPSAQTISSLLRRIRLTGRSGLDVDISKSEAQEVYSPRIENLAEVTAAVSLLYSTKVEAIHPAEAVPEDAGLDEPRLVAELTTTDTQYTLELGNANADGTRVYARFFPKFEGLVVELREAAVRDLLKLDQPGD